MAEKVRLDRHQSASSHSLETLEKRGAPWKWVTFSFRFFFFVLPFLGTFSSSPAITRSFGTPTARRGLNGRIKKFVSGQAEIWPLIWFVTCQLTRGGIFPCLEQGFCAPCAFAHSILGLWSLSSIRHNWRQTKVDWLLVWVWKCPKSDFFDYWDLTQILPPWLSTYRSHYTWNSGPCCGLVGAWSLPGYSPGVTLVLVAWFWVIFRLKRRANLPCSECFWGILITKKAGLENPWPWTTYP